MSNNNKGFQKIPSSGAGKSTNKPPPEFPVVDESWELIDPTPDIHGLFVAFNRDFFFSTLGAAEVKWSKRMTSCAGTCSFSPKGGSCIITLSEPLLKLRPRKDLVETLLHEMIHAYLFLYDGRQDREAHGPLFLDHMHRINGLTGADISVYHSFHNEVREYQTHWWRCEGPCKDRKPYHGYVKRSMNRAPGPNDFWFKDHQSTCGGKFIKIKEPPPKPAPPKKRAIDTSTAAGWAKLFGLNKKSRPVTAAATASSSSTSSTSVTNGYFATAGVGHVLGDGSNPGRTKPKPKDDYMAEYYRQLQEYSRLQFERRQSKLRNPTANSATVVKEEEDDDVQFLGFH